MSELNASPTKTNKLPPIEKAPEIPTSPQGTFFFSQATPSVLTQTSEYVVKLSKLLSFKTLPPKSHILFSNEIKALISLFPHEAESVIFSQVIPSVEFQTSLKNLILLSLSNLTPPITHNFSLKDKKP